MTDEEVRDPAFGDSHKNLTPDGWLIAHDVYTYGPFPDQAMAQFIADASLCPCEKAVVPVFFPPGVSMTISVDTLVEGLKERQAEDSRLN